MGGVDRLTPEMVAALTQQQAPQLQIAQPINDVQLVAWIAGGMAARGMPAGEAVNLAYEVVGEAIEQHKAGAMGRAQQQARGRLALLNGQALTT